MFKLRFDWYINEETPSREWEGCIHCFVNPICNIEIITLISTMFFSDEEGNLNEWMERMAVKRDWGMLLQSVCTYVSSSHANLLEQKLFT